MYDGFSGIVLKKSHSFGAVADSGALQNDC
jgi:hypothetical protein